MTILVQCPGCALNYVEPDDNEEHDQFHRRWEAATAYVSYYPAQYGDLERRKHDGYQLRNDKSLSIADRARGALMVLEAHFERSLWAAVRGGNYRKHPNLARYVSMRLVHTAYPPGIQRDLEARFGKSNGIASESSYFETTS